MDKAKRSKNSIPDPCHAANALSITSGHETIGFVVEHDKSFFAFNAEGILLGEYQTQRAAVRSIPPTKLSKEGIEARKAR
jgi:hypothetical protein